MPTLEELENDYWGPPGDDTHLVKTCHVLRSKNLDHFTFEDYRILIGQNIGLSILLPRVLPMLMETPWASGNMYEGNVLISVLECKTIQEPQSKTDHQYVEQVKAICKKAIECAEPEDPFFGCTPQDLGLTPENAATVLLKAKQEMMDDDIYQQILAFTK